MPTDKSPQDLVVQISIYYYVSHLCGLSGIPWVVLMQSLSFSCGLMVTVVDLSQCLWQKVVVKFSELISKHWLAQCLIHATDHYLPVFYVFFCSERPHWMYVVDSLTLNSQSTALWLRPWMKLNQHTWFLQKAQHSILELRTIAGAAKLHSGALLNCAITTKAHKHTHTKKWTSTTKMTFVYSVSAKTRRGGNALINPSQQRAHQVIQICHHSAHVREWWKCCKYGFGGYKSI